ncbi:hypothetical protein KY317_02575 [Candidatus Woesearchaeota archaeon]|nr:hypothetical protein [Candidatus Woesearchaeota archaeon]
MKDNKTNQLLYRILGKQKHGRYSSAEELHKDLYRLGKTALEEKEMGSALRAYNQIGDKEKIRIVGEKALEIGELVCALDAFRITDDRENLRIVGEKAFQTPGFLSTSLIAFEYLRDRKNMFKVMMAIQEVDHDLSSLEFGEYIGKTTIKKADKRFKKWLSKRGFRGAVSFNTGEDTNMAYHLADKYDIGIGIAKGGLYLTYIFDLFGLETRIAQSHRNSRGATFRWREKVVPEELEGKDLVVFDKDVVSGRTTTRVLRELQKYNPNKIDLVVSWNPVPEGTGAGMGTRIWNVPDGYNEIYYPGKLGYGQFDKAVRKLEQMLEDKK